MHLAKEQILVPSPRSKGISVGEGHSGEDNPTILWLQKEINVLNQKNTELDIQVADLMTENTKLKIQVADLGEDTTLKTNQIIDLQTHFGLLTTSYFDLKKKLEEELGDKFKSYVDESRMYMPSQAPHVVPPPVQTSRVVDRFEEEPTQAPNVVAVKRAKMAKSADKRQALFKRISDQNAPGDQPKITVTDLKDKRFREVYGDRSGIVSLGFHDTLNMWLMRRKNGNTEFYKDFHDFHSWTRVDLI